MLKVVMARGRRLKKGGGGDLEVHKQNVVASNEAIVKQNVVASDEAIVEQNVGASDEACRNPTLKECEDETHTPEMGTWESFGTPKTSKFDCRGQNTSHLGVFLSLESYQSVDVENGLHGSFGHLHHKLWQKERSEVKLVI